eukprot:scpid91579/ scgid7974/ 
MTCSTGTTNRNYIKSIRMHTDKQQTQYNTASSVERMPVQTSGKSTDIEPLAIGQLRELNQSHQVQHDGQCERKGVHLDATPKSKNTQRMTSTHTVLIQNPKWTT